MSPDISCGDDGRIHSLVRERVLGGGIAVSALLWAAGDAVAALSRADSPAVMCLIAAASTVSLFCALVFVGFGTRRVLLAELGRLAAEVEQLNAKFDEREAAWTAINRLTDGALNGGRNGATVTGLRRQQ